MSDEGWVVDVWLITEQVAAIVQPYVDEPIDAASEQWYVSSEQA